MQQRVENQTRLIQFMGCILGSLLLVRFTSGVDFNDAQYYVLFLVYFSIGLWITEAIPPFAVGVMIVGFLVFFLGQPELASEGIDVQEFVHTWSNSVIWLLLGGFFLAAGMKKSGLDMELFRMVISRFGHSPAKLLLALMLTTAAASMLMSNTATTAMMLAALGPLISQVKGTEKSFTTAILLGIPAAASIGGMGTIIGSPPNAIAVDAINRSSIIPFQIGFFEWMLLGVPLAIVLTLIVYFALMIKYRPPGQLDFEMSDDQESLTSESSEDDELHAQRQRMRKRIVISVMGVTILLWLTDGWHPIPAAAVSGIPIVALTMTNIVTGLEVRSLPWDTLMLVAGGLSLGLAIETTDLANYFITSLQSGQVPPLITVSFFAFLTVVASNFMSNTAATAILVPAAALWTGVNPLLMPLVIGLSASCALLLPVSTPPNAIAYASGKIEQGDFRLAGITAGLAGPILAMIWCWLVVQWLT